MKKKRDGGDREMKKRPCPQCLYLVRLPHGLMYAKRVLHRVSPMKSPYFFLTLLLCPCCDSSVHGRTGTLFMANARLTRSQVAEGGGGTRGEGACFLSNLIRDHRTAHARLQADYTA